MDRVVVALGGNALLRRGEEDTFENMTFSTNEVRNVRSRRF
jgi:carbamate kinase